MDIGITCPIMEPEVSRDTFQRWAELVDTGPFSTYAIGERIAFPNPHILAVLAATAAWTRRVELTTTVIAAPLYDPVMLAKELASIDLLSDGRLSVGLGVGGRTEDYAAAGVDVSMRTYDHLGRIVDMMKRTWDGERVREGANPVGPKPTRPGGLPLLSGAMGPKGIRASAVWADAITGFSMNADPVGIDETLQLTRQAWEEAGRKPPRLITSFWFAVGPGARDQMNAHLRRYLAYHGSVDDTVVSSLGFAGSAQELRVRLKQIEDLGCDEVILATTASDTDQVTRLADLLG